MRRAGIVTALAAAAGLFAQAARAQVGGLFAARPGEIVRLVDRNGDGDFLDFAEQATFADGLPSDPDRLAASGGRLYVGAVSNAEVWLVEDRNGDGDALDFAEVSLYGRVQATAPAPALGGLAVRADGALLAGDAAGGRVFVLADLNGDGDALDFAESRLLADGLSATVAVALRPDGRVLVAQTDVNIPVRILEDRNGDGDCLDFAENLSYAEALAPGADLSACSDVLAYLARPASGEIVVLRDLDGDNDALDFGEVIQHAGGLAMPGALTPDGAGGLYVVGQDAAGTVYHVRDLNGDGDALDFGEVTTVAAGLTGVTGLVRTTAAAPCLKGDADGDGVVDAADAAALVNVLLGLMTPPDPCPTDVNGDGTTDGRDVPALVLVLLSG